MGEFCGDCENLLAKVTTADSMYFRCNKCGIETKPNPSQTLLHEHVKGTNLFAHSIILHRTAQDPVCQKVYRDCSACGGRIARQTRLGEDKTLINVCIECNRSWPESEVAT